MKNLLIFGLIISLHSFASEEPSSKFIFSHDPSAPVINIFDYGNIVGDGKVHGKAKIIDVYPNWEDKKITRIIVDGDAGKKLYDDLESEEVDLKATTGYKVKQKQSKDGNIKCSKSDEGSVCNVYLNSKTGEGAYKVGTERDSTPCEAVSDKSRDDLKEIHKKIKSEKFSKKATKQ